MSEMIALGPFQFDVDHGRLRRDGIDRDLRPQVFRVLKVLVENRGALVPYDRLAREAWDVHVSHHTVATTVNEVKHLLDEYGSWIVCRPKIGYRLDVHRSDDLIRRGCHFRNQYTREGFENALHCFRRASEDDATDFRAFEAIANTYLLLAGFLMRAPSEMSEAFVQAHSRATLLCEDTPALRLDQAFGLCVFERNPEAAEVELRRLQKQLPDSVHVYVRLALVQLTLGRLDPARSLMQQAIAIDPLAPELAFLEIVVRLFGQDFEAAVAAGKRAMDLHPGSQISRAFYAEALDFAGYHNEAIAQYRLAASISPDTTWIRADEASSLALHGATAEAVSILDELESRRPTEYVDAYHMALVREALGQRDKAFQEMERAREEKSYALLFSLLDAKAAPLRADPRFEKLRRSIARPVASIGPLLHKWDRQSSPAVLLKAVPEA